MDIGIDLGTASVLIYRKGEGIVLQEPSVVAIDSRKDAVIAVGAEAYAMLGRAPETIRVIRPLRDGVISDYRATEILLRTLLKRALQRRSLRGSRLVLCVPSGVTEVEKRSAAAAVREIGIRHVHIVEEPVAAAIGAGLDIFHTVGCMVVDVGGGTTDIALLSQGGLVASETLRIAGDELDEALADYMKHTYQLLIGSRTAEEMKKEIGSVYPRGQVRRMRVAGRDLATGLPRYQSVGSDELIRVLDLPIQAMLSGIAAVLERTPPQLREDLTVHGVTLTGGGALLYGLDKRICQHTGLPCTVPEAPLECVARGAGKLLEIVFPDRRLTLPEKLLPADHKKMKKLT